MGFSLKSSQSSASPPLPALIFAEVLGELVELFPAEDFLTLLPAEGSLWFLLPFITRSLQRKHLDELKATITDKGKSLLMQLNTSS